MAAAKADKPLLWLVRQPQGLVPYSRFDADIVERYRIGAHVTCTLDQPVDPHLTRRFHGMIGLLAKGIGEDAEDLKRRLMVQAGSVGSVTHIEGLGTTIYPKKWSELEHPAAVDTFDRVAQVILTQFLPGMKQPELEQQILKYIGVQP